MSLRKNKKIKNMLILGVLLFLIGAWWMLSLAFNSYTGLSSLKYEYKLNGDGNKYLYKNEKINGEFLSRQDNLGIVYVRFSRYVKPDFELEDEIVFRIREKNDKKWMYVQKYHSGLVEGHEVFPFGIPVISNSKNNVYVFEVESLKGNKKNALQISRNPEFLTEHVFPLTYVKNNFPNYLIQKTVNSILNDYYLINSTIFLLPLMLFILFLSFIYKNKIVAKYLPVFTLMLVLIDLFILPIYAVGITFVLIILWLISIRQAKIESSVSFLLAGSLFSIWFILTYFTNDLFTEKLNIWTYAFLVIGIFQLLLEFKFKVSSSIDINTILKEIRKYGKI